jgi:hypothetical protein
MENTFSCIHRFSDLLARSLGRGATRDSRSRTDFGLSAAFEASKLVLQRESRGAVAARPALRANQGYRPPTLLTDPSAGFLGGSSEA